MVIHWGSAVLQTVVIHWGSAVLQTVVIHCGSALLQTVVVHWGSAVLQSVCYRFCRLALMLNMKTTFQKKGDSWERRLYMDKSYRLINVFICTV